MNYIKITKYDIANGEGIRVVLWISGCKMQCKNCHNPNTWDFCAGKMFDDNSKKELFEALSQPYIQGITFSGGHPLEKENITAIYELCKKIKEKFPRKDIWIYTGYIYENIKDLPIMQYVDILVDGKYIDELRNLKLKFRGSENQRIIDVQKSIQENKTILWDKQERASL